MHQKEKRTGLGFNQNAKPAQIKNQNIIKKPIKVKDDE